MIITLGIIGILLVLIIISYNNIVKQKNMVEESWSQIDVLLKQRFEMIPNLVEVVKGYSNYEKNILENVVNARNRGLVSTTRDDIIDSDNQLTQALSKLFVLTEAYPDLKADKHYIKLQTSLEELENKIAFARQFYNDTILKYNLKIETMPSNIVAILFGFKKYNYFKVEDKERQNVNINLK